MPLLGKRQGGSGIGPYLWEHDGDQVDVPDPLFTELLNIKGADFYVPEPDTEPEPAKTDGGGEPPADPGAPNPDLPPTAAAAAAPVAPVAPAPPEATPTA